MNRELNIAGVMITCPGREAQLKATLADLRRCEVLADGHQALGECPAAPGQAGRTVLLSGCMCSWMSQTWSHGHVHRSGRT